MNIINNFNLFIKKIINGTNFEYFLYLSKYEAWLKTKNVEEIKKLYAKGNLWNEFLKTVR